MDWAWYLISEVYRYLKLRDDSTIDRLNRLYTVALLSAFVSLITTQQQIVGKRIVCWTPQEFTGAHVTYAEGICWLGQSNYYVSENTTQLTNPSTPRAYPFLLYPWLPLILLAMTGSLLLPYFLLWHGLARRTSLDVKRLLSINQREQIVRAIDFTLGQRYSRNKSGKCILTPIYLLMKLCHLIIILGQLLLMNKILFGAYFQFDFNMIREILSVKYNLWSSVSDIVAWMHLSL